MKIGVVLVTFNRLDKLKIAIEHYEEQSCMPEYILIVDNCSTDGTKEFLEAWKGQDSGYQKETIYLSSNTGGAGGFYAGMERALTLDADWVWLSDDDAYPRKDALQNLKAFYESQSQEEQKDIAALCSTVYNNGQIHEAHRNHMEVSRFKCRITSTQKAEYENEAFRIDIFSYVGALIKKDILKKVGLDRKEFFIYCDDQEHSLRVGRAGKIYCVTNSIVDHDTPPFNKNDLNWGLYYKKRNDLLMIKANFPYRYFLLRFVRRYLGEASFLSSFEKSYRKVHRAAFLDALRNKTGLHDIYRPGWKPE